MRLAGGLGETRYAKDGEKVGIRVGQSLDEDEETSAQAPVSRRVAVSRCERLPC
jgi:hypothetical protein